jgi:hypothetical protein
MTPIAPQPLDQPAGSLPREDRVVAIVSFSQVLDQRDLGSIVKTTRRPVVVSINPINDLHGLFEGPQQPERGAQETAFQPSGKGISGQAPSLSLAAFGVGSAASGAAKASSFGAGAIASITAFSNRSNSTSLIALSEGSGAHGLKSLLFPD